MSEPSPADLHADLEGSVAPHSQAADSPKRGIGAILGSTAGLLLLLALLLFTLRPSHGEQGEAEILGDLYWAQSLPFDFETLHRASLSDGRLVELFGLAGDLPDLKEMGDLSAQSRGGMGEGGNGRGGSRGGRGRGRRGRFSGGGMLQGGDPNSPWLKLPMQGEPGRSPWQAALVHYPSSQAEKVLSKGFGRLDFKDLSTIGKSGGSTAMDSGHVLWSGFRLPYVRTRHFRNLDGQYSFHDSMRINLSRDRHALVLYTRWRPGQQGDIEQVRPLLDALAPKESARSLP